MAAEQKSGKISYEGSQDDLIRELTEAFFKETGENISIGGPLFIRSTKTFYDGIVTFDGIVMADKKPLAQMSVTIGDKTNPIINFLKNNKNYKVTFKLIEQKGDNDGQQKVG